MSCGDFKILNYAYHIKKFNVKFDGVVTDPEGISASWESEFSDCCKPILMPNKTPLLNEVVF